MKKEIDMQELLTVAVDAAKRGGGVLRRFWDGNVVLKVDEKGANDYVTQVDRESEKEIVSFIHSRFPDHDVMAEEFSRTKNDSRFVWCIDPLDGTTNFIHRFPVFCVSIALLIDGDLSVGVVYDPMNGELFHAVKGNGAFRNGAKISVSSPNSLKQCLLATGFPFKQLHRLPPYLVTFDAFCRTTSGIRRAGSAAIDLCCTAAGIFDGFWEQGLAPWDIAAGTLLVREAGGIVTDFQEGEKFLESGDIVAASAAIHREMMKIIRTAHPL